MAINFASKHKMKDVLGVKGLKHYLHNQMAGMEKARPRHNIHASDVTNQDVEFCPREQAILDLLGTKPPSRFVGTSLRYTFDLGNSIAALLIHDWAREVIIGDWKCSGCGSVHRFCKLPSACKDCGCRHLSYQEVRVLSKTTGISGGIDTFIKLPGWQKYRAVELKTMEKEEFKALKTAKAEHRIRTTLYLDLIADWDSPYAKFIDKSEAHILYMIKGFGVHDLDLKSEGIKDAPFTPFKEFYVKPNAGVTAPYLAKGKALYDFRNRTGGMPKGVCPSAFCKRADKCSVKQQCFSANYPLGMMKPED